MSYVRVKPNRSARWQHIERYSQRILFTRVMYVCRYISEQKATFGRGPDGGGEAVGRGRVPTQARAHAHTTATPRPCVSNQPSAPTDPTTDSTYSYYYERRNAFCRARTKFVALRLPIIKIVNAFQAEVCLAAQRCRPRVATAFWM